MEEMELRKYDKVALTALQAMLKVDPYFRRESLVLIGTDPSLEVVGTHFNALGGRLSVTGNTDLKLVAAKAMYKQGARVFSEWHPHTFLTDYVGPSVGDIMSSTTFARAMLLAGPDVLAQAFFIVHDGSYVKIKHGPYYPVTHGSLCADYLEWRRESPELANLLNKVLGGKQPMYLGDYLEYMYNGNIAGSLTEEEQRMYNMDAYVLRRQWVQECLRRGIEPPKLTVLEKLSKVFQDMLKS